MEAVKKSVVKGGGEAKLQPISSQLFYKLGNKNMQGLSSSSIFFLYPTFGTHHNCHLVLTDCCIR